MKQLEEYITIGTKRMRCGYTTGTCAAAAARAAAELLLRGKLIPAVVVSTPAGIDVMVEIEEHDAGEGWAECAVRKDSGDDPDVTNGALVYARVEFCGELGIHVDGGIGVGRVTREGLDQPVGAAAINSTPRRMIEEQIESALGAVTEANMAALRRGALRAPSGYGGRARGVRPYGDDPAGGRAHGVRPYGDDPAGGRARGVRPYGDDLMTGGRSADVESCGTSATAPGLLVTISIPEGVELAAKTFNPRLGIEGGISVLGTSGIVRPMSEDALISSIELEMRTLRARGIADLLVVPGNYGRDFACGQLNLNMDEAVSCSNYFGATIDAACMLGFERMLIVGHIGKMAKVAGGIMNTHSRMADCRVEVLAAHAALVGAPQEVVRQVMDAATTDAALDALIACGLEGAAMRSLMANLADKLYHRADGALQIEAIVFSNVHGVLGQTPGAAALSETMLQGGKDEPA